MLDDMPSFTVSPSDLVAERGLLALIIADNATMDRISDLKSEDFYDPTNQAIFDICRELRAERRPINLVTIKGQAHGVRLGDGQDVAEYLRGISLAGEIPDARDIVQNLRELSTRRALMRIGEALSEMAQNYRAKTNDAVIETVRQLDTIADSSKPAGKTLWTVAEAVDEFLRSISNGEVPDTISSGVKSLDAVTGGFRPGEYWLLAGRPSMGKSSLAVALALGAGRAERGVMLFSLEMSIRSLAARIVSEAARREKAHVPYSRALAMDITQAQAESLVRHGLAVSTIDMTIEEQAGLTVSEIAARVRKQKEANPNLGLVIVDHIGKITPSSRYSGNRTAEMTEISTKLSEIAKSERVCLLALSQLNRQVESRENKRPGMSDLRDSGSLEQDADVIMFAYRGAYYLERTKEDDPDKEAVRQSMLDELQNKLEVVVAKNRNGQPASVELYVDMAFNYIADLPNQGGHREVGYGR